MVRKNLVRSSGILFLFFWVAVDLGMASAAFASPYLDPSVFVAEDYLEINGDVAAAGMDAGYHWLHYGISECRRSSWHFAVKDYMTNNPDVAAQFSNNCAAVVLYYVNLRTEVTVTSDPPNIMPGDQATLHYDSNNATSCTASGGGEGWDGPIAASRSGSVVVRPSRPTTYTLTCTGPKGTESASVLLWVGHVTTATPCSQEKMSEILAPASVSNPSVSVNCRLDLRPTDRVTKQITIRGAEANGTRVFCNGATLEPSHSSNAIAVVSRQTSGPTAERPAGTWSRPFDVQFVGCNVIGSIPVVGIPNPNGPGLFQNSSRVEGHTKRAQDSAPSHISFISMKITAKGNSALYVAPGATHITLRNSQLRGESRGPAVYLDAETAFNTIQNNGFAVDTTRPGHSYLGGIINIPAGGSREILAIDGSANNKIIGNVFSELDEGGIYLYRNCGEGGVIRHQTPHHNQIIDNVFYYNKYDGSKPSIWVSSRDGDSSYCGQDAGYPFGSSKDNRDYATDTAIIANRIYKFAPSHMVRIGPSAAGKVDMQANVTVPVGALAPHRDSPCYDPADRRVYEHGASRIFMDATFACDRGLWISPLKGSFGQILDVSGRYELSGWACMKDENKSIDVDLYVDGPSGVGSLLARVPTNVSTTAAIDDICGTQGIPHVFRYRLSSVAFTLNRGKAVFVQGVSRAPGVPNDLLVGSGKRIPTDAPVTTGVIGLMRLVQKPGGDYVLNGWTCVKGLSKAISAQFYSQDEDGVNRYIGFAKTDLESTAAIDAACGTLGIPRRFSYLLTAAEFQANKGKKILGYGISGEPGIRKDLLEGSGIVLQ